MKIINLPNCITISRIILAFFSFLFIKQSSFYIFFLIAGITDFLDGFLARKMKMETMIGAKLDSFADLLLTIVLTIWLIQFKLDIVKDYAVYLLLLTLLKIGSIAITYFKFKIIAIVHTVGNKVLGFLLFLLPFINERLDVYYYIAVLVFALLIIIEELLIAIISKKFDINLKSIIHVRY